MSHFAVLVIGDNHEELLAPFHEFECTGTNDQYVQDIDKTEEAREEYKNDTDLMLESPEGERVCAVDDRFYRDPTPQETKAIGPISGTGCGHGISWASKDWGDGKGYRAKVAFIPEGWKEVRVPTSENQNFVEWCADYYGWKSVKHGETPDIEDREEHKYGYVQLDENGEVLKCIDRTNPNSEWDWYVIGGRYRGWFPLKEGVEYSRENLGKPGTHEHMDIRDGKGEREDYDALRRVDQAKIKDIDFERGRDLDEIEARKGFAKWREAFEKHGKPEPWAHFLSLAQAEIAELKKQGLDQEKVVSPESGLEVLRGSIVMGDARSNYHQQPAIAESREFIWECPVVFYGFDEEAYVARMRDRAMIPYVIVKDGKWYGKGEMGWWGTSTGDKDQEKWNEEIHRLFEDLPPDTQLTLVDCHT